MFSVFNKANLNVFNVHQHSSSLFNCENLTYLEANYGRKLNLDILKSHDEKHVQHISFRCASRELCFPFVLKGKVLLNTWKGHYFIHQTGKSN
jgi:hypothetical protein